VYGKACLLVFSENSCSKRPSDRLSAAKESKSREKPKRAEKAEKAEKQQKSLKN